MLHRVSELLDASKVLNFVCVCEISIVSKHDRSLDLSVAIHLLKTVLLSWSSAICSRSLPTKIISVLYVQYQHQKTGGFNNCIVLPPVVNSRCFRKPGKEMSILHPEAQCLGELSGPRSMRSSMRSSRADSTTVERQIWTRDSLKQWDLFVFFCKL